MKASGGIAATAETAVVTLAGLEADTAPWIFTEIQEVSGDSWMCPYQRTPMGNPYISPILRGYSWVFSSHTS